eukprot:scaffold153_cov347-Pavlova_lutheri.AAC.37
MKGVGSRSRAWRTRSRGAREVNGGLPAFPMGRCAGERRKQRRTGISKSPTEALDVIKGLCERDTSVSVPFDGERHPKGPQRDMPPSSDQSLCGVRHAADFASLQFNTDVWSIP